MRDNQTKIDQYRNSDPTDDLGDPKFGGNCSSSCSPGDVQNPDPKSTGACSSSNFADLGMNLANTRLSNSDPSNSACMRLYQAADSKLYRISEPCRSSVKRCGPVAKELAAADLEKANQRCQDTIRDLQAQRKELAKNIDDAKGQCVNCQMNGASAQRSPSGWDYALAFTKALAPVGLGIYQTYQQGQNFNTYAQMYQQGLNAYSGNYGQYLQQCSTLGVPCQQPGYYGIGGSSMGAGMSPFGFAGGTGYAGGVSYAGGTGYPGGMSYAGGMSYPGSMSYAGGMGYPGSMSYAGGMGYPGSMSYAGGMGYTGGVSYAGGMSYPGSMSYAGGMGYTGSMSYAGGGSGYPGGYNPWTAGTGVQTYGYLAGFSSLLNPMAAYAGGTGYAGIGGVGYMAGTGSLSGAGYMSYPSYGSYASGTGYYGGYGSSPTYGGYAGYGSASGSDSQTDMMMAQQAMYQSQYRMYQSMMGAYSYSGSGHAF
jgi:hypothetical protein